MSQKTMKAIVAHGPHDYRLEDKTIPVAGKEEVIVKVKECTGEMNLILNGFKHLLFQVMNFLEK
jgi:hypothetical protein